MPARAAVGRRQVPFTRTTQTFFSSFTEYALDVSIGNRFILRTWRRYSEFEEFHCRCCVTTGRELLRTLPELPPKVLGALRPEVVAERAMLLRMYLAELLLCSIRSCRTHLDHFLELDTTAGMLEGQSALDALMGVEPVGSDGGHGTDGAVGAVGGSSIPTRADAQQHRQHSCAARTIQQTWRRWAGRHGRAGRQSGLNQPSQPSSDQQFGTSRQQLVAATFEAGFGCEQVEADSLEENSSADTVDIDVLTLEGVQGDQAGGCLSAGVGYFGQLEKHYPRRRRALSELAVVHEIPGLEEQEDDVLDAMPVVAPALQILSGLARLAVANTAILLTDPSSLPVECM